ncbi:cupin [Bacterioplanes sanyensis]|uniref:Cupin n=1 Tax=Bacterioplanes sanyensis TaxID=1249553 RepID=A0A222FNA7_9GAMM|nr:cupin domain-containing protein [Bacterioplanes sanyensis]ASP40004.1 cupin [Bacterioplanes sanyensis]
MHVLGDISVDTFLRDYWQKKPLLIRNAWPDFRPLIDAEELAGLALEDEIESRLIVEHGEEGPWQLQCGPLTEEDFRQLPESHWTLLIQAVDHWLPEAANILDQFRFIPGWRRDDLMISYAADGGSVGPHYDQYDVFLLQAEGQREWRIGQHCDSTSACLKGSAIRVLEQFEQTDSWVLNPGDMLYLPPQLAHYGTAVGSCMTYSIGFRAPSASELSEALADQLAVQNDDDWRYQDHDLEPRTSDAEITHSDAQRLLRTLQQAPANQLQAALGQLMTQAKYPELTPEEWPEAHLDEAELWYRPGFVRMAYSREPELQLFAMGEHFPLPLADEPWVKYVCEQRRYTAKELQTLCQSTASRELLQQFVQRQWLQPEE